MGSQDEPVAVLAEIEEGVLHAAGAEALRRPGGDAEDDSSGMVRAMACRSPAAVMPKYSRTAALGLVTDRSTMRPSSSSTKSSVTGWS